MDIRTKLALILVFVSLLSMSLLGAFAYQTSSKLLQEISERQLNALAEGKAQDLLKVHQGWQDQLRLIKSAIELQSILIDFDAGDLSALVRLDHLVEHALAAVKNVKQIKIIGRDGDSRSWGEKTDYAPSRIPTEIGDIAYGGVFLSKDGPRVTFSSLLVMDEHSDDASAAMNVANGKILGHIEIVFDASDLESVTGNYTGLGDTGEAMVVVMENPETVLVLNELRHSGFMAPGTVRLEDASDAIRQVLAESSGILAGVQDYRGEQVLAATRFLPELKWGLVVKVDSTEEGQRADFLLKAMFDIGLALSAFAIIIGSLLGWYWAGPIHALAVLVERVRQGETSLRADIRGDDEIAFLAESVNMLLDKLNKNPPSEEPDPNV